LVYGEYNDCNLRISWHQVHKSNRLIGRTGRFKSSHLYWSEPAKADTSIRLDGGIDHKNGQKIFRSEERTNYTFLIRNGIPRKFRPSVERKPNPANKAGFT